MPTAPIKGYEGVYTISDTGEVFSVKNGIVLKTQPRNGYECVCLSLNGKRQYPNVHRLVAIAFIDNQDNKEQVNHIDGNKMNNNASNLEWCTHSENMKHCFRVGLQSNVGENHSRSVLNNDDIRKIIELSVKHSQSEIAKMFSVGQSCISRVVNRVRWSHVGV